MLFVAKGGGSANKTQLFRRQSDFAEKVRMGVVNLLREVAYASTGMQGSLLCHSSEKWPDGCLAFQSGSGGTRSALESTPTCQQGSNRSNNPPSDRPSNSSWKSD